MLPVGSALRAERLWRLKEGTVWNLPICNRNAYFLFKSVITDFSSGYLSVYSSLSAFSIPVRDRKSCTFFSNCLFSFTENLPNLIATPRIGAGRKSKHCQSQRKSKPTTGSSAVDTVAWQLPPAGNSPSCALDLSSPALHHPRPFSPKVFPRSSPSEGPSPFINQLFEAVVLYIKMEYMFI